MCSSCIRLMGQVKAKASKTAGAGFQRTSLPARWGLPRHFPCRADSERLALPHQNQAEAR